MTEFYEVDYDLLFRARGDVVERWSPQYREWVEHEDGAGRLLDGQRLTREEAVALIKRQKGTAKDLD